MYKWRIVLLLILTYCNSQLQATEVNYLASIQLANYSNINQVNQAPGAEFSESVRGEISIREDTSDVRAVFDMYVESINFEEDFADDETVYSLLADLLVSIDANRLEWYISGVYTQTPIDTLIGDIQTNRQYASAFSTGPNYLVRINRVNMLALEARVGRYEYEINNADNNRFSGAAIWSIKINPSIDFAVNFENESVVFDKGLIYKDYNRYNFFLSASNTLGVNTYDLELGQSKVNYDDSSSPEELIFLLSAETRRTSSSRLRLELGRSFIDSAMALESQIGGDVQFYTLSSASSDLYVNKIIRLIYGREFNVGGYEIQLISEENRYQQQIQEDYDRQGAIFRLTWNTSRTSNFILESRSYSSKRINSLPEQDIDEKFYSLSYSYSIRQNIALELQAIHQNRDSTINIEDYDDTRYLVSLVYRSL